MLMTWEPGNTGTPAVLMTWEPGNTGKQSILITCDPGNTGKQSVLITWDPGNTGTQPGRARPGPAHIWARTFFRNSIQKNTNRQYIIEGLLFDMISKKARTET